LNAKLKKKEEEFIKNKDDENVKKDLIELYGRHTFLLHDEFNDNKETQEYYLKALKLDPEHSTHCFNYAIFLDEELNNVDEAKNYYIKAIELEANRFVQDKNELYVRVISLINFLKKHKKYEDLDSWYYRSVKWFVDLGYDYCRFLILNDRKQDAINILHNMVNEFDKKLEDLTIKNNRAEYELMQHEYSCLANFCLNIKEPNESAKICDRALDWFPTSHNMNYYYGYVLQFGIRDYPKALIYYKKAVDSDFFVKWPAFKNEQIYALYLGAYADCLRIVEKNYKKCDEIFCQAFKIMKKHPAPLYNIWKFHEKLQKCKRGELVSEEEDVNRNINTPSTASLITGDYVIIIK